MEFIISPLYFQVDPSSRQNLKRLKHKNFCANYNLKRNRHGSFQGGQEGTKLYQCTKPLLWADLATIFLLKGTDPNILPYTNFKGTFYKRTLVLKGYFYA